MYNKPLEKCPSCNRRLDVRLEPMQFENDDTPNAKTIAYEVQSQLCNNPLCISNGVVINVIKNKRD